LQCVVVRDTYSSTSLIRIVCCSVLQCVAVCCSVLQCVAVCCSVLQCVAVCCTYSQTSLICIVCCSVLQCVAVCCSVLQCVTRIVKQVLLALCARVHVCVCVRMRSYENISMHMQDMYTHLYV